MPLKYQCISRCLQHTNYCPAKLSHSFVCVRLKKRGLKKSTQISRFMISLRKKQRICIQALHSAQRRGGGPMCSSLPDSHTSACLSLTGLRASEDLTSVLGWKLGCLCFPPRVFSVAGQWLLFIEHWLCAGYFICSMPLEPHTLIGACCFSYFCKILFSIWESQGLERMSNLLIDTQLENSKTQ